MNSQCDVIIVGAGAAGLFCAYQAASKGLKTLVLEHNEKPGKKILISGGGRCNFTNLNLSSEYYQSQNSHFVKSALAQYDQYSFIELVESHDISYYEKQDGQLFCEKSAKEILKMLLDKCQQYQVQILYNFEAQQIRKDHGLFTVSNASQTFSTSQLVIASGGLSISALGASDFGYRIAKQFGHSIIPPTPALVPFVLEENDLKNFPKLAGISLTASIKTRDRVIYGQLLFTHKGISGPAVLNASLFWCSGEEVVINLCPQTDLRDHLHAEKKHSGHKSLGKILADFLPKKFVLTILEHLEIDSQIKIAEVSKTIEQRLVSQLQSWSFIPAKTEGFRKAEVTKGGVNTLEISSKTMESKLAPGLFFIGEVLDVTGMLGGYNFQWSWSSAFAASRALVCLSPERNT